MNQYDKPMVSEAPMYKNCPKCYGLGHITRWKSFIPPINFNEPCDLCNGKGVVPETVNYARNTRIDDKKI